MNNRRFSRSAFLACGLLLVLMAVSCVLMWRLLHSPGKTEFLLHRSQYERLVEQVKATRLAPGVHRFLWSADRLQSLPHETDTMAGRVTVEATASGLYQITLITEDQGHSGAYGYIYSDAPLSRRTDVPYRNIDTMAELVFVREQVSPHWYSAYNDLY